MAGAFGRLETSDVAVSHYRSGALAAFARGESAEQLIHNLLGTTESWSKGMWRGDIVGSLSQSTFGHLSGSLGTPIALAVGAAFASSQRGLERVVVATVGDGTMNAGLVLESIHLAALYAIPLVLVCQDNQYATSLRSDDMSRGSFGARAAALGMPVIEVDGNDALAVADSVQAAVQQAREGRGPTFIHARTYRMAGHWVGDPEAYRSEEEVESWRARDPLQILRSALELSGAIRSDYLEERLDAERENVAIAYDRALNSAPVPGESLAEIRTAYSMEVC